MLIICIYIFSKLLRVFLLILYIQINNCSGSNEYNDIICKFNGSDICEETLMQSNFSSITYVSATYPVQVFKCVSCNIGTMNKVRQLNFIYIDVEQVDLSSSNISHISINGIVGDFILVLNLSSNAITTLDTPKVFEACQSIRVLDISHNRINEILIGTFEELGDLEELYLGHNQIKSVEDHTFAELFRLKTLSLINNQFNCIEYEFLLNSLKSINIAIINEEDLKYYCKGINVLVSTTASSTLNDSSSDIANLENVVNNGKTKPISIANNNFGRFFCLLFVYFIHF